MGAVGAAAVQHPVHAGAGAISPPRRSSIRRRPPRPTSARSWPPRTTTTRSRPYAHLHNEGTTVESVLASQMLWDPIRYDETCPSSDGACAFVIVDEDTASSPATHLDPRDRDAVRGDHGRGADQVDPQAGHDAAAALGRGGNTNPLEDRRGRDLLPFSWFEPMWLENLGFMPEGDGWKLAGAGETAIDGKFPVNCSGGVLSSNPIGASGCSASARRRSRWSAAGDHQVDGVRRALGHAYGGGSQFSQCGSPSGKPSKLSFAGRRTRVCPPLNRPIVGSWVTSSRCPVQPSTEPSPEPEPLWRGTSAASCGPSARSAIARSPTWPNKPASPSSTSPRSSAGSGAELQGALRGHRSARTAARRCHVARSARSLGQISGPLALRGFLGHRLPAVQDDVGQPVGDRLVGGRRLRSRSVSLAKQIEVLAGCGSESPPSRHTAEPDDLPWPAGPGPATFLDRLPTAGAAPPLVRGSTVRCPSRTGGKQHRGPGLRPGRRTSFPPPSRSWTASCRRSPRSP